MEIFDSSAYVIERAKRLAQYFSKRSWFVTSGKSNSVLVNIMEAGAISYDELLESLDHFFISITTIYSVFAKHFPGFKNSSFDRTQGEPKFFGYLFILKSLNVVC